MKTNKLITTCYVVLLSFFCEAQNSVNLNRIDNSTYIATEKLESLYNLINAYLYKYDETLLDTLKYRFECKGIFLQSDTRHSYSLASNNFDKNIIDQNLMPLYAASKSTYVRDLKARHVKEITIDNIECVGFDKNIIYISFKSSLKSPKKKVPTSTSDRVAFIKHLNFSSIPTISEINFLHQKAVNNIKERAANFDREYLDSILTLNEFEKALEYCRFKKKFKYQNDYSVDETKLYTIADQYFKTIISTGNNNLDLIQNTCFRAMKMLPVSYHKLYRERFTSVEQLRKLEEIQQQEEKIRNIHKLQEEQISKLEALMKECRNDEALTILKENSNNFIDNKKMELLKDRIENNYSRCKLRSIKEAINTNDFEYAQELLFDLFNKNMNRKESKKFNNYIDIIYDGFIREAKQSNNEKQTSEYFNAAFEHKSEFPDHKFNYKPEKYFLKQSINQIKEEYNLSKNAFEEKDFVFADEKINIAGIRSNNFKRTPYYNNIKDQDFTKKFNSLSIKIRHDIDKTEKKIEDIEIEFGNSGCDYFKYKYLKNKYNRKTLKLGINTSFNLELYDSLSLGSMPYQYYILNKESLGFLIHYGQFGLFVENYNFDHSDPKLDLGAYWGFLQSLHLKVGYTHLPNQHFDINALKDNYIFGLQYIWTGAQIGSYYKKNDNSINITCGLNLFVRFKNESYQLFKSDYKSSKKLVKRYKKYKY